MRLKLSPTSRAEHRIEDWIAQRHQERVLSGQTTPTGPCPDDAFLNDLARRSKRIALSDPRVDHAATCPRCMKRLLEIRPRLRSHRRRVIAGISFTSCLTFAVLLVVAVRYWNQQHSVTPIAVAQTIDLWNAGVTRGTEMNTLESVSLPAANIKATVILPAFSAPGQYLIAVTRDRDGNGVVAEGQSMTETVKNQQRVLVELDLRRAKAGKYFLSTTHEQDQASYYYPLEIK